MLQTQLMLAVGAAAALAAAAAAPAIAADCAALAAPGALSGVSVTSAQHLAATDAAPAHCELTIAASAGPGSAIVKVVRLPDDWNGKLYAAGGSGYAGNLKADAVAPALARGYATISSDMGHPGTESLDMDWILTDEGKLDEVRLEDFGIRSAHMSAVVGKAAVLAHYGQPQTHAYWQGCSTGGRQGMSEAQRYPDDFDGIIAGAPVFNAPLYTQLIRRSQYFRNTPGALITSEQVPVIRDAVLAACDGLDGVEDGYLTNPLACTWDPAELACTGAETGDAAAQCLSPEQVTAVRQVYAGETDPEGRIIADPSMRGGEWDWQSRFIANPIAPRGMNLLLGSSPTAHLYKLDPDWEPLTFDGQTEMAAVEEAPFGRYMYADDPDITAFVEGGGKLLLWHGFNDSGPSALQTLAYYKEVERVLEPQIAAPVTDSVRYFLAPGVGHCRGGGGPDQFDLLAALENWVEKGEAPERIIATKAESPISRPLCPWPLISTYRGTGDSNDAANFDCAPMSPAE